MALLEVQDVQLLGLLLQALAAAEVKAVQGLLEQVQAEAEALAGMQVLEVVAAIKTQAELRVQEVGAAAVAVETSLLAVGVV